LPTNAELATALAAADDAVLAAIAALNNLSQANVRTALGVASANLDTQLSGINTKTTNLPSDPADASDLAALFASLSSTLSAIVAKTNLLPATPAATGDAMTLTSGERTSIADTVLTRDWTAIVVTVPARCALNALRFLRNKWTIIAGVLSVKKEDDAEEAWNGPVTTAPGDPVSGIDPS
jgi:hypothetical protein